MTSTRESKRSISKSFETLFDSQSTENNETSGVSQTSKKTSSDSGKNSLSLNEKKEKARWQRIKRVYGLSQEDYDRLDKGHCPICLRAWSDRVRPAIDHDHVDGWVRGILCLYCNRTRVGRFRDHQLVQRIADYLNQTYEHVVPPKKKRSRVRKKKI